MPTAQGCQAWAGRVAAYGPYLAFCVNLLATQRAYPDTFQSFSPAAKEDFEAMRDRLLTPLVDLAREPPFLPKIAIAHVCC